MVEDAMGDGRMEIGAGWHMAHCDASVCVNIKMGMVMNVDREYNRVVGTSWIWKKRLMFIMKLDVLWTR